MNNKRNKGKNIDIILLLVLLTLVLLIINLSIGSVNIPFSKIVGILAGSTSENEAWNNIIMQFRLPKALTAILVGAGLSVSGLQMQTLFRNPLAGPYVLGISSGASLGVAIVVLAGNQLFRFIYLPEFLQNWTVVTAAILGAAMVLFLVLLASVRIRDSMTLLILGLMFGSATGALVSVLQYFSEAGQIQVFLIWTFGSLGGITWDEMYVFLPILLLGLLVSFFLSKPLNALLLGENYAESMGLNVKRARILIIVSTSLLAGSITAFAGPISFIGIAVPHLTRFFVNTSDHRPLLPAVILVGSALMLLCDTLSQLPGSQQILPINAITSLFGAPVVIWVILRRRNVKNTFAG